MSDTWDIRAAVADDVDAMLDIYGPIVLQTPISFELTPPSPAEFRRRLADIAEEDPWLVVVRDGVVGGYAYASTFRSRPAYRATKETTVYLHPDHYGQGLGRRLMESVLTTVAHNGAHLVIAGIVLPNESSIALHERLGFRHVGTFADAGRKFDRWHDLGFWQYSIPESGVVAISQAENGLDPGRR